jgi:hypothetical protein
VSAYGTLHYHGDFDWGCLHRECAAWSRAFTLWRFDTTSYLAARDIGRPLGGVPVEARRDADLRPAMRRVDRGAEEELVLDDLLSDLSTSSTVRRVTRKLYSDQLRWAT